jgi:hypothetical protein
MALLLPRFALFLIVNVLFLFLFPFCDYYYLFFVVGIWLPRKSWEGYWVLCCLGLCGWMVKCRICINEVRTSVWNGRLLILTWLVV